MSFTARRHHRDGLWTCGGCNGLGATRETIAHRIPYCLDEPSRKGEADGEAEEESGADAGRQGQEEALLIKGGAPTAPPLVLTP